MIAGIIQLMFQLPFLRHLKLLPSPKLKPRHEGVDKIIALMVPVMFSVSVGQINLLLDTVLATALDGDGAVSWLYYSDRLMELPLGIFAIAIATVILPTLSRIHAAEDTQAISQYPGLGPAFAAACRPAGDTGSDCTSRTSRSHYLPAW